MALAVAITRGLANALAIPMGLGARAAVLEPVVRIITVIQAVAAMLEARAELLARHQTITTLAKVLFPLLMRGDHIQMLNAHQNFPSFVLRRLIRRPSPIPQRLLIPAGSRRLLSRNPRLQQVRVPLLLPPPVQTLVLTLLQILVPIPVRTPVLMVLQAGVPTPLRVVGPTSLLHRLQHHLTCLPGRKHQLGLHHQVKMLARTMTMVDPTQA